LTDTSVTIERIRGRIYFVTRH